MQILWPVFALFALTAAVVFRLGLLRLAAVRARQVDARYYRVYQGEGEPEAVAVWSRHLVNLFEAPVLFYVGAVIAFVTGQQDAALVSLAWLYVAVRLVHSWIHLGRNTVLWRFRVFGVSWLVLAAFWMLLAIRLAGGGQVPA